jgi:dihydroorotase
LKIGSQANISIVNPTRAWKVDRDLVASRSRNTPYHGMEFAGSVVATVFRGIPSVLDSKLVRSKNGN